MKKILFLWVLGIVMSLQAYSSHIVGGEFEVEHIEAFNYRVRLLLYFDVLNGNAGARDDFVSVSIFQKSTDELIRNITLPSTALSRVDYFQPECSNGEVITDRIIYEADLFLSPEIYNDPGGYYFVWQRCCRNYTITNIRSDDPNSGGIHAGQTFYLEFPPVVDENGEQIINSSPQLFPPLNDYACPNRPYWVDFQGTDLDGDSLTYQLVNPLSTQFASALPPDDQNLPAPYNVVTWSPGFGRNSVMLGDPDLEISVDGFLSVTPKFQGLFVFAVRVDEFRDGVKIGEVRRDFQLLVVDKCPEASPPVVSGKKMADADYTFVDNMNVTFSQSLAQEERCIDIRVSDLDALKAVDEFTENISISAIPLNFKDDVSEILPEVVFTTLTNGSTFDLQVCFPECPYLQYEPFQVGIVAFDDACALPLTDTLRVTVNLEPPPNQEPYFEGENPRIFQDIERINGLYKTDIIARDNDLDSIYMLYFPLGFIPEEYGISWREVENERGYIRTEFEWNYDCKQVSFDGKSSFDMMVLVEDVDQCNFENYDTLMIDLSVILPPNSFPEIYSEDLGTQNDRYFHIEKFLDESLSFDVFAKDLDNDPIIISGEGANFDFDDYESLRFPERNGFGNPGLGNSFSWDLECDLFNLSEQDSFRLYLMVEDIDYCNITSRDTVTVDLKLKNRENDKPVISFQELSGFKEFNDTSAVIEVSSFVNMKVTSTNEIAYPVDIELVSVEVLSGKGDTTGFNFPYNEGIRTVSSNLTWAPGCNSLGPRSGEGVYLLTFRSQDYQCQSSETSFAQFVITVVDTEIPPVNAEPPNVISPNGDGKNDVFTLQWMDEGGNRFLAMPEDKCANSFLEVRIYNRWGNEVYRSSERNFTWDGGNSPAGVYYYQVDYTEEDIKGIVTKLF